MPLLIKSTDPRLLFITSGLSTLTGCSQSLMPQVGNAKTQPPGVPAGWPKPFLFVPVGYRSSKAALNMMMLNWHWILHADGVKTWSLSPGFLATGLGGNPEALKKAGAGDPSLGGEFIQAVIEGERDADVGKVINRGGLQPW
jgi:NAD(P)-dependent dehydrogenase (short-subunit alcohol dehydrogenase family)